MNRLGALVAAALLCSSCASTAPESAPTLERGAVLAAVCSGCHAPTGTSVRSLSGYSDEQLVALMRGYASAEGGTAMHRLARGYSEADMKALADYLALSRRNDG